MAATVDSVPKRIAVIGAGVSGLSSALFVKTEFSLDGVPCSIDVFAERISPFTTSDGAAGFIKMAHPGTERCMVNCQSVVLA